MIPRKFKNDKELENLKLVLKLMYFLKESRFSKIISRDKAKNESLEKIRKSF